MMVIRGNTTEHSIAASDSTAFGTGANLFWVYNATSGLFQPNPALRTLLDSTTTGPWRVVSVAAITRRGNGGTGTPNAATNGAILPFIRFDGDSNIDVSGARFLINTAGDTIQATRDNTQIIHTNLGETSIYPADRCTWRTGPDGDRGYRIDQAVFYPGNAAAIPIVDPALGYIGKTGRFVEIAS